MRILGLLGLLPTDMAVQGVPAQPFPPPFSSRCGFALYREGPVHTHVDTPVCMSELHPYVALGHPWVLGALTREGHNAVPGSKLRTVWAGDLGTVV